MASISHLHFWEDVGFLGSSVSAEDSIVATNLVVREVVLGKLSLETAVSPPRDEDLTAKTTQT